MAKSKRGCENCEECTYIGEGDSICLAEDEPRLVMDAFIPADDYFWCGGKKWTGDK